MVNQSTKRSISAVLLGYDFTNSFILVSLMFLSQWGRHFHAFVGKGAQPPDREDILDEPVPFRTQDVAFNIVPAKRTKLYSQLAVLPKTDSDDDDEDDPRKNPLSSDDEFTPIIHKGKGKAKSKETISSGDDQDGTWFRCIHHYFID